MKNAVHPPDVLSRGKRALFERLRGSSPTRFQQPITPAPRTRYRPLSSAQERIWLEQQLDVTGLAFNEIETVRIAGPVVESVLELALYEIVRRHEVLRVRYVQIDGETKQEVLAHEITLPILDVSALPPEQAAHVCRNYCDREFRKPFSLDYGSLFRTSLVRMAEQEHILVVSAHHICFDAWSVELLLQELRLLYDAFLKEQDSPLPELELQYSDYAHWERTGHSPADSIRGSRQAGGEESWPGSLRSSFQRVASVQRGRHCRSGRIRSSKKRSRTS